MKHYNFGSIEQYRNVVKEVQYAACFEGKDADGKAIYDWNKPKPIITFTGTVKLHGTNAAIVYSKEHGLYAQSRERIITVESDNAGFAFWVESNKEHFEKLLSRVLVGEGADTVVIFGEWAGGNIQKGVGICNVKKQFYPFLLKYFNGDDEVERYIPFGGDDTCESWLENSSIGMYPITQFTTYTIDIDFNHPEDFQNQLAAITEQVEQECPVAKAFGYSGIGEGVVWVGWYNGKMLRFKVKGEKHSSSKVKTLASVDTDKIASCKEFAEYAVTDNRFNQAIEKVFGEEPLDVKRIGEVLSWTNKDILKEEIDTLKDNGLEFKDVVKYITEATKKKFFKVYNKL